MGQVFSIIERVRGPFIYGAIAVAAVGLISYAALRTHDSGSSSSTSQQPQGLNVGLPQSTPAQAVFVTPQDGAKVSNPVTLHMAVAGMLLEPATKPAAPREGHFRVIVDGEAPAPGQPVSPKYTSYDYPDGAHLVTLPQLSPGKHKLTLVIEDSNHKALAPLATDTITVTVTS